MRRLVFLALACLVLAFTGCGERSTTPHQVDGSAVTPLPIPDDLQTLIDPYIVPEGGIPDEIQLGYLEPTNADYVDGYDVFSVTFLWGDIFGSNPSSVAPTDWSGNLTVNGDGMVRVRYVIDFEPGEDSILPVLTPTTAAWASTTLQDVDGINFVVYMKRVTPSNVPSCIVFSTEPFTVRLLHRQLFNYAAFYQVGETKGVAVHSRVIWQNTCPGGTMEGLWIKQSFDQGRLQGRWFDHTGEPIGYMSGTFWTNDDGRREFSGSVSGIYADVVIAEFHGIWNYDDTRLCPMCGDDHGYFIGRFKYLTNDRHGVLKGVFGDYSLPADQDTLPYIGIWRENCVFATPEDASGTDR